MEDGLSKSKMPYTYLKLPKDPQYLKTMANKILQSDYIKLVEPIDSDSLIKIFPIYTTEDPLRNPLEVSDSELIRGYEIVYNLNLYKKELIKSSPKVRSQAANNLLFVLSYILETEKKPGKIISNILGGIFGLSALYSILFLYKDEFSNDKNKINAAIIIIVSLVISLLSFIVTEGLGRAIFITKTYYKIRTRAIDLGYIVTDLNEDLTLSESFTLINKKSLTKIITKINELIKNKDISGLKKVTNSIAKRFIPENSISYKSISKIIDKI